MENCAGKLEAMFQKADSDIDALSKRLELEFEIDSKATVNPAELMTKINEAKREYAVIVKMMEEIKQAQKEAGDELRANLKDVCGLLAALQSKTDADCAEKPEEINQLEKYLGTEIPWGQSSTQSNTTNKVDDDRPKN